MMNEEVRKIMTTNPIVVHPDQSIEEVSHLMIKSKLQQMPVIEDDKFVGLLTTYDLWRRYENNSSIGHMKVRDVMNTHVVKISPKDKVGTAAELFADRRFKTIPVVNIENKLKGVITAFDIIRVVYSKEYDHPILYSEEFTR